MTSNPLHRKFGLVVSNLGRIIAIFGLILAKQRQEFIIGAIVLAVVLLIASILKASKVPTPKEVKPTPAANDRARSPPRDIKRD